MDLETLVGRVAQLTEAVTQSAANHNSLVGRMNEAQEILNFFKKGVAVVESVVDAVEGVVEPAVEPPAAPAAEVANAS